MEDFTENEEVNKMKEALLFYQDAARKIEESKTAYITGN